MRFESRVGSSSSSSSHCTAEVFLKDIYIYIRLPKVRGTQGPTLPLPTQPSSALMHPPPPNQSPFHCEKWCHHAWNPTLWIPYWRLAQIDSLLPLFIRGKLGTSKIDCRDKIQKKPCLFTLSSGKQAVTVNGSALLRYGMINSVQKLTQVIKSNSSIPKNTETTGKYQREY